MVNARCIANVVIILLSYYNFKFPCINSVATRPRPGMGENGCLRKVLEQTVCRIDLRIELLQQEQAGTGGDTSYKDGSIHQ